MSDPIDLGDATAATFEPHLGSAFGCSELAARFLLIEVSRHANRPLAPRPGPFSLVFTGPDGVSQRTYRMHHPALGPMNLFLVPIGPGFDGAARYEAVFN